MKILVISLLLLATTFCGGESVSDGTGEKEEVEVELVFEEMPPKRVYNYTNLGVYTYLHNCASCHGLLGEGDGTLSPTLKIPVKKFSDRNYKGINGFSREGIKKTLINGLPNKTMTSYRFFPEETMRELVEYTYSLRVEGTNGFE